MPALGQFLGSTVGTWKAEQRAFCQRNLSGVDCVYLWVDGIHVNIRLEEHKLCLLVRSCPATISWEPPERLAFVTFLL